MKMQVSFVLGTLLLTLPDAGATQEAWLLVRRDNHHAIERVVNGSFSNVLSIGNRTTYGESERAIAILSRRTSERMFMLDLVDKTTGRITSSWPVKDHPVGQLSGPSKSIVLIGSYAYFATVRYGVDGNTVEANEAGGHFDFYRLSLSNGTLDRYALPSDCQNPRVVDFAGIPLIYSWNGPGIWKFDAANGSMQEIVSRADIEDTLMIDRNAEIPLTRRGNFADYVVIPRVGMFRLSRLGVLSQVLDSDLSLVDGVRATLDLGSKERVVKILPGTFKSNAAIGVVSENAGRLIFKFVDPLSMRIEWETTLPQGTVPDSIFVSRKGALYYVDRVAAAVRMTSEAESNLLWPIEAREQQVQLHDIRILLLNDVP